MDGELQDKYGNEDPKLTLFDVLKS